MENRRIERYQKFDETCAPFLAEMKNLSDVNGGSLGNVCVETRFRSQFRIVPKAFILFGKDKDVYKKDEGAFIKYYKISQLIHTQSIAN